MRKKIAIAFAVLVVLGIAIAYNVGRAGQEFITATPGALELGRQHLHTQLEQATQDEAQVEKQAWNSPAQLRVLIQAHQHRIEQLSGNSQAGEIVAYDRDAITRLEKRIAGLAALQEAGPAAQSGALESTPQQAKIAPKR